MCSASGTILLFASDNELDNFGAAILGGNLNEAANLRMRSRLNGAVGFDLTSGLICTSYWMMLIPEIRIKCETQEAGRGAAFSVRAVWYSVACLG